MGQVTPLAGFKPPSIVNVFYTKASGDYHQFTSSELPGLLIYHKDLKVAFKMLGDAITHMVTAQIGQEVCYELDTDYDDFERKVKEALRTRSPAPNRILGAHPVSACVLSHHH